MSQTSSSMAERNDEEITNHAFTGHAAPDHTSSLESPQESPAEKPADEGPELTFLTTLQVLGGFMCLFNSYVQSDTEMLIAFRWGYLNAFGVFQNYYKETLIPDSSNSQISWIGSVQGNSTISFVS
jgi:hypothetical protein